MILGNATTLGLDLGATGVRAAEVAWQGGRPTLVRWAAADFPVEVTDWRAIDRPAMVASIRGMLSQARMDKIKWAAHSISGESVALQYFNFPKLMAEDVAEAVRIEAETALPFRADGALISYVLYPEQRSAAGKARSHGLAIAADGQFAKTRMDILREARLEPFCIETDATATCNAFLATHGLKGAGAGTTALVNIGYQRSNLAVLNSKGTLLIRDVPWGGVHFTKALGELMGGPVEEAEGTKRADWNEGEAAANPQSQSRIQEAIRTGAKEFVGRLHDTIEYWVSEQLADSLEHVFITGGGSQVHGLPEFLADSLAVPVERWSPLLDAESRTSNAESDARNPKSEIHKWTYRMSVAFGLALRRFGE
ncbi:MAG: pilus assembly protein PilM [Candidatus Brocadiia bacterium]|jgi:type IV pilus assembly protein PilM